MQNFWIKWQDKTNTNNFCKSAASLVQYICVTSYIILSHKCSQNMHVEMACLKRKTSWFLTWFFFAIWIIYCYRTYISLIIRGNVKIQRVTSAPLHRLHYVSLIYNLYRFVVIVFIHSWIISSSGEETITSLVFILVRLLGWTTQGVKGVLVKWRCCWSMEKEQQ